MVNLVLQGVSVGIHLGQVFTTNPRLKKVLEKYLDDHTLFGPGDGDPDYAYAKLFVETFGGRITKWDLAGGEPDLVY